MGKRNNFDNAPIMGDMPTPHTPTVCEEMESPIFLSRQEAGAIFNAIGFCVTSVQGMKCLVQEPALAFLLDEEMEVYAELRSKLFHFLSEA